MAIFKVCYTCGDTFHGGDGFYRVGREVFCCEECMLREYRQYGMDWGHTHALRAELDPSNADDQPLSQEQLLNDLAFMLFRVLGALDGDQLQEARRLLDVYHGFYR